LDKNSYHWYILSVRGGREEKIIAKIWRELKNSKWKKQVKDLKVVKNNRKETLKGFVFCRAYLDEELVRFLYKIPEVIGFFGYQLEVGKLPNFISESEMKSRFFNQVETTEDVRNENYFSSDFKIGDLVKIMTGIFANYEGKIVKLGGQKVSVEIEFAGKKNLLDNILISDCQKVLN
jgi:transcription termination/antitermination protein NusG